MYDQLCWSIRRYVCFKDLEISQFYISSLKPVSEILATVSLLFFEGSYKIEQISGKAHNKTIWYKY